MRYVRLCMVTALLCIIARVNVEPREVDDWEPFILGDPIEVEVIPPIPEYQFYSLLDQTTGTFK